MLTMKSNLYNPDGTLSVEAQLLISPKPVDMSITERRKAFRDFDAKLTAEEVAEFKQLKRLRWNSIGGSNQTKEQRKEIDKQNYYRDPLKHIQRGTSRSKARYKTDPLYRMKQKLRWALRDSFNRIKKASRLVQKKCWDVVIYKLKLISNLFFLKVCLGKITESGTSITFVLFVHFLTTSYTL